MKFRIGACALMLVLAGCSGESPESGMAGMRGVAASKPAGSLPTALPLARAIGADTVVCEGIAAPEEQDAVAARTAAAAGIECRTSPPSP